MRWGLSSLLAGCLVVFVAACDVPSAPTADDVVAARSVVSSSGAVAAADGGASSGTLVRTFIRGNDCNGEQVEISGTAHLLSHEQADGSVVGHINYQGLTGVGLTSGARYHVSAVDHFRLQAPFPSSIQSVRNIHLIAEGPTEDLLVQIVSHVTVDANGNVTASVDDMRSQCR